MSEENVELARQGYVALNETIAAGGDLSALIAAMHEPDVVVEMGVLEGTFRGREGVQRFLEGQIETIGRFRTEPQDFIAAGNRVVVPIRVSGTTPSNGLTFEAHYVHVITFRNGKAARVQLFGSRVSALAAVGLRE